MLEWATNWIEPAASFNNDDLYQLTRGQSRTTTYMDLVQSANSSNYYNYGRGGLVHHTSSYVTF